MKKLLLILVIAMPILASILPDAILWCKRAILSEPTIHQVDAGEYLSKISLKYYGNEKFWRELALINRAPDSDLIFPGEEIFIPAREVIEQLHRARSLSSVNSLVDAEKEVYAQNQMPAEEALVDSIKTIASESGTVIKSEETINLDLEPEVEPAAEPKKALSLPLILSIIGSVLFLAAIVFLIYLRRNQTADAAEDEEPPSSEGEDEPESEDETEGENETEPNYTDYKKSRSKRVYV